VSTSLTVVRSRASAAKAKEVAPRCAVCGWTSPLRLLGDSSLPADGPVHAHHAVPLSLGGGDDGSNLLSLCPNHHAVAHDFLALLTPALAAQFFGDTPRDVLRLLFEAMEAVPETLFKYLAMWREARRRPDATAIQRRAADHHVLRNAVRVARARSRSPLLRDFECHAVATRTSALREPIAELHRLFAPTFILLELDGLFEPVASHVLRFVLQRCEAASAPYIDTGGWGNVRRADAFEPFAFGGRVWVDGPSGSGWCDFEGLHPDILDCGEALDLTIAMPLESLCLQVPLYEVLAKGFVDYSELRVSGLPGAPDCELRIFPPPKR